MNTTLKRLLLAGAFAIAGVAVASAEDKASAASEKAKAAESTAKAEMDKAKEQFKKQTDAMLTERQKLLDQLKGANEAQRKAILEKMQQQQETMRELGKLQRDEARRLRETSGKPGGR